MSILFAIVSYFGWGTGDIFGTVATRKIGAYSTTLWVFLFGAVIFSFYIPFALNDFRLYTLSLFLLNALLGFFFIGGNLAFNEALRISNASLVGTIAASFAALTVILSVVFLGDKITFLQAGVILLIFFGLALSTLNFRELKNGKAFSDKGILLALVAMVSWAIYFTFVKTLVNEVGWFWPNYISFLLFPLFFLYMKIRKIRLERPTYNKALLPLLASTFLLRSGDFSFNLAISQGLTSIVAPIAGSYPTLFVILAFLIFKDPITRQQVIGITTTLIGIVLLSIFS